jgi:hypothetical protein
MGTAKSGAAGGQEPDRSWTLMGTAKSGAAGGQEPDRSWTLMDTDGNSQELDRFCRRS